MEDVPMLSDFKKMSLIFLFLFFRLTGLTTSMLPLCDVQMWGGRY